MGVELAGILRSMYVVPSQQWTSRRLFQRLLSMKGQLKREDKKSPITVVK